MTTCQRLLGFAGIVSLLFCGCGRKAAAPKPVAAGGTQEAAAPGAGTQEPVVTGVVRGSDGPTVKVVAFAEGKPVIRQWPASAPTMKVAIFADGRITAEGSPATVDSLREVFLQLAQLKGVVWVYQEPARGQVDPPPQALQVIQAAVKAGLALRQSHRPDYSDFIGSDGRPVSP